jgi:multiple sugar transport system permease protein
MKISKISLSLGIWTFLGFLTIICLFPLFWMISLSLRLPKEYFLIPQQLLPPTLSLTNYLTVFFKKTYFFRGFLNSTIVGMSTVIVATLVGLPAAYGFSRFNFPGHRFLFLFILFSQIFPGIVLLIPLYMMLSRAGLIDSLPGLSIVYLIYTVPRSAWLLTGFINTVPKEIEEAALVEGCSRISVVFRIVVPLVAPGLAAVSIFSFIICWKEFLFALTFINTESNRTLPVVIASFFQEWRVNWTEVMAVSVLATIPVLAAFAAVQRFFIQGLTEGGIRG